MVSVLTILSTLIVVFVLSQVQAEYTAAREAFPKTFFPSLPLNTPVRFQPNDVYAGPGWKAAYEKLLPG